MSRPCGSGVSAHGRGDRDAARPDQRELAVAGVGDAGERHRRRRARPALNVRPPSALRDDAAAGVGEQRSRRRERARRATIGRAAGPASTFAHVLPASSLRNDVAAQAEDEHGALRRRRRRRSCPGRAASSARKRCAAGVELQHEAALAGDVQLAGGGPDRVEVEEFRIVGAVEPRRPRRAAVVGAEDQVVGADHVAFVLVGEPHVEERLVGALLLVALALRRAASSRRRTSARAATLRSMCGEQQLVGARPSSCSVQVSPPSRVCRITPSWPTAQPCLRVDEVHRGQVRAHRHRRLLPGRAAVGRHDDVAALADRDEAVAGARHRLQQALRSRAARSRAGASSTSTKPAPRRAAASVAARARAATQRRVVMISMSKRRPRRDARSSAARVGRDVRERCVSARPRRRAPRTTTASRAAARSCT